MQVKGDEMETLFFLLCFCPFLKAFFLCLFLMLLSDCIVSSALIHAILSLRLAEP